MKTPEGMTPVLTEIAALFSDTLQKYHDQKTAECLALTLINDLKNNFSAQSIYIPRGDLERRRRDAAIRACFEAGLNRRELARRFGLSVTQIYAILPAGRSCLPPGNRLAVTQAS
ncbi:MAG: hypothetical protein MUC53_08390 [Candidatus Contendobacter sp.]|jgi:Mor family transcriptional regulator|nr:hypothetical protein [Candidatus Contendobacter sp.]